MTPAEELSGLYDQWLCLTEEEGSAIESGEWGRVEHYQAAKSRLQPRIAEVSGRVETVLHELQFRPIVQELMELERRNSHRLREMRRFADQQRQELDKSSRNLRQLHKTYVPSARAFWHSYS